jgi:hypothetical protein
MHFCSLFRHKWPQNGSNVEFTPNQFSRYVIETVKRSGPQALHLHQQPFIYHCNWCSIKYDVIVHLETYEQDFNFIERVLKLKVIELISRSLIVSYANILFQKINVPKRHLKNTNLKEFNLPSVKKFFSQLSQSTIKDLYQVYKDDFIMLGYNETVKRYISLGKKKANVSRVTKKVRHNSSVPVLTKLQV